MYLHIHSFSHSQRFIWYLLNAIGLYIKDLVVRIDLGKGREGKYFYQVWSLLKNSGNQRPRIFKSTGKPCRSVPDPIPLFTMKEPGAAREIFQLSFSSER